MRSAVALLIVLVTGETWMPKEHQDECPDPTREKVVWSAVRGRVADVRVDGMVQLVRPKRRVRLISVTAINAAGTEYLRSFIGKRVEVWVALSADDTETVTGVMYAGVEDVNRTLLQRGLARYVPPAPHTVSEYADCLHRIAAREAARR